MRRPTLHILTLTPLFVLSACGIVFGPRITGSGVLLVKKMGFTEFTSLRIGSAFEATVTRGDTYRVEVTADDNLYEYIRVTQEGSALAIYLDNVSVSNATLKAAITMPLLEGLRASGAADVSITGFKHLDAVAITCSGASYVNGDLEATSVQLSCSGASEAVLRGIAVDGKIDGSGASSFNLTDFALTNARVDLSGASSADINVTGELHYDLSGASNLRYGGSPHLGARSSSGASSAHTR
ncbi:MAG: DUF2807 domain-containing protein [Phycisphaerales bacterium]|nr:MAG: DUF2807 domain-containing protein [Phycisphaerales bacterium]